MNKSLGIALQVTMMLIGGAAIVIAFSSIVFPIFQQAIHLLETGAFGR